MPTNLVPEPIEPNRYGCTFMVTGDVTTQTFNHVVRELVVNLFDEYEQEWINEIKASLKTMNSRVLVLGRFSCLCMLKIKKPLQL